MKMRSEGVMAMARPREIVAVAFISVVCASAVPSPAQAQSARLLSASPTIVERQAATTMTRGRVSGVVSDDRGGPLPGAMVSMLGVTMATAVADDAGHFSLDALPVG